MLSDFDLSVRFFLQLGFILGLCRLLGWLARLIHQPQVVGEMIAGVVRGPSLSGWLFPAAQAWLFPEQSKTILFAVSQVGLALYMFLVGLELRSDSLRQRARSAVSVSVAGMLTPFGRAAWCVLAVVIASMDHSWSLVVREIGGGLLYAVLVLTWDGAGCDYRAPRPRQRDTSATRCWRSRWRW